jgi:hypothetical protein
MAFRRDVFDVDGIAGMERRLPPAKAATRWAPTLLPEAAVNTIFRVAVQVYQ